MIEATTKMKDQLDDLEAWFSTYQATITAFSGGIDSALVLYLSHLFLGDKAIGCISISPSLKRRDYQEAITFCEQFGIRLEVIETKEIEDKNYLSNPSNRCYFCKSHLYADLNKMQQQYPGYTILNGTNKDDYKDYRPGIMAANEHNVQSPLADCGLRKGHVRAMGKHFGLPNWNKPASPCLSSRVPYGEFITPQKLKQIEQAEGVLNQLGFKEVRVRHYGTFAKVEVPIKDVEHLKKHAKDLQESFRGFGFEKMVIDEEGFISGKLNRSINQ